MKSNFYLYCTNNVPDIPQDIIDKRIELLEIHLAKLLTENWLTRDGERVNAVCRAIEFWKNINKRDGV